MESKDPENLCIAMRFQGILTRTLRTRIQFRQVSVRSLLSRASLQTHENSWRCHLEYSSACGLRKSSGADFSVATSTPARKSVLGAPATRAHVPHSCTPLQNGGPE